MSTDQDIELIEVRLAASRLDVPDDLRAGVLAGCRALLRMTALLQAVPLTHEDEPAGVLHLPVERDVGASA